MYYEGKDPHLGTHLYDAWDDYYEPIPSIENGLVENFNGAFVTIPYFDVAVAEGARKMRGYPDHDYPDGCGFAGVYNSVKAGMKIQLITARNSALDIILNFHSTIVMNVISHSHAYSLYP
ncbi:hypothetical protein BDP27DRAFT_1366057 [Rhodocollybia butyracea]|uniref:Uncharacterized protein n=1 Tax=Rhodocollybia butyracea TaxID=206335 RepID=A0A9P5PM59_9AGAR|nr:hypothetical protein BDP27DRAFT_1366057 [Rhodocollybia butyracea]